MIKDHLRSSFLLFKWSFLHFACQKFCTLLVTFLHFACQATDANGQFTTKYYVCGDDWSVREISPSEGYLLDESAHHIGAEAKNYTVEYNFTANDVTEQVVKGNIALIKHTDDGETQLETPEAGAEFEVYLKKSGSYENAKETEHDYLVCDENGFAQTKDLPYGIYTVHQVKGWDGRELLPDFDVYIAKNGPDLPLPCQQCKF